jgi:hypothetical protein
MSEKKDGFEKCGRCGVAVYCTRDCQGKDWKEKNKEWRTEMPKRSLKGGMEKMLALQYGIVLGR